MNDESPWNVILNPDGGGMTWQEEWAADIHEATKDLPESLPLAERIRIVDAVKHQSPGAYSTSWGKKSWQAARRDYLVRYGYKPQTKKQAEREQAAVTPLPLFPE